MLKITINPMQRIAMLAAAGVLIVLGILGILQRANAHEAINNYTSAVQAQHKDTVKQIQALGTKYSAQIDTASAKLKTLSTDSDEYAVVFEEAYGNYGKDLAAVVKRIDDQKIKLDNVFLGKIVSNSYRSTANKAAKLNKAITEQYAYAQAKEVFYDDYGQIHISTEKIAALAPQIISQEKATSVGISSGTTLSNDDATKYAADYEATIALVEDFKKTVQATPIAPVDAKNRDKIIKATDNFLKQRRAAVVALKKNDTKTYQQVLAQGSNASDASTYNNFLVEYNTFTAARGETVQKYADAEKAVDEQVGKL